MHQEIKASNSEKLRVLYVGRVSREKNIAALCQYESDFDVAVVGNGPHFEELRATYKKVQFVGYKFGKELAKWSWDTCFDIFTTHLDSK